MSFRGGRGGSRGGSGGFSRGGGGGFSRGGYAPQGPPATVLALGKFLHACEGEMVCESTNVKIPYFNAPVYLENKTPIGKVDEILGPLNQVYFTVKPQDGIVAGSFKAGDAVYIGGDKLLPLEKCVAICDRGSYVLIYSDRFLPKPKPPPGAARVKKPAGAGRGGFGGRGGARGGARGAPRGRGGFSARGGSRGGFSSRGGSGFSGRGGSGFAARGAPRGGRGGSRGFSR